MTRSMDTNGPGVFAQCSGRSAPRTRHLLIGEQRVQYTLVRHPRAKRVTIRVSREGVRVSVPAGLSLAEVDAFVAAKANWIVGARAHYLNAPPPLSMCLREEKMLPILGESRRLRFESEAQTISMVEADLLLPAALQHDASNLERSLRLWLTDLAGSTITELISKHSQQMGVHPGRIALRDQKTRWASCTSKGSLSFNWRLIMAPLDVIDYVVVHELVHLMEMNHSTAFWQLVARYQPRFQDNRRWLRDNGWQLRWD